MTPGPDEVAELLRQGIPDSTVQVRLFSGHDHFEAEVISEAFRGKSRVAQHQMVYAALGEHMRKAIHALTLKTCVPEE